jgi:hypothetical protein
MGIREVAASGVVVMMGLMLLGALLTLYHIS